MFLRDAPEQTLSDVIDSVESTSTRTLMLSPGQVQVNIPAGVVSLDGTEFQMGADGIKAFGTWLDIPSAFLLRQEPEFQQQIVEHMLGRSTKTAQYQVTDTSFTDLLDANVRTIPIERLLHAAGRAIDLTAPVRDFWSNSDDFRLDIYAPEGFDRGIGGDPKVGDLSAAGVRLTQDRKHNLAPQVQPFQYRFWCTNGATSIREGLKVDARGQTVEEILAEFEAKADLAFRQAENDIAAFYEMRSQRVDNPERTLLRMAQDNGLAPRIVTRLLERVPAMVQEVEDSDRDFVSNFDLINLITNAANDPAATRVGTRDALQMAGGSIVTEHAERCGHCQSRLNH